MTNPFCAIVAVDVWAVQTEGKWTEIQYRRRVLLWFCQMWLKKTRIGGTLCNWMKRATNFKVNLRWWAEWVQGYRQTTNWLAYSRQSPNRLDSVPTPKLVECHQDKATALDKWTDEDGQSIQNDSEPLLNKCLDLGHNQGNVRSPPNDLEHLRKLAL